MAPGLLLPDFSGAAQDKTGDKGKALSLVGKLPAPHRKAEKLVEGTLHASRHKFKTQVV